MEFIFTLLMLYFCFKVTGFVLKIFGAVIGTLFSFGLHVFLAFLAVVVFGLGVIALPFIFLFGAAAILMGLGKIVTG